MKLLNGGVDMKKKLLSISAVFILLAFFLCACSGSNLDGHYIGSLDGEPLMLDIEGESVVLGFDYTISVGEYDKDNKVIKVSNSVDNTDPDEFSLDVVNGKVVLTFYGETVKLEKDNFVSKIDSLNGKYTFVSSEYDTSLSIKDDVALLNYEGLGNVFDRKDNVLTDNYRNDTYYIKTVFGALVIGDEDYYRYGFYKQVSDLENESLKSDYVSIANDDGDPADELEIDVENNTVIYTTYGESVSGTIDTDSQTIELLDGTWKYDYMIFGNQLAFGQKDYNTYEIFVPKDEVASKAPEKQETSEDESSDKEKETVDKFKYVGNSDYIQLGEYYVGSDIKPGTYNVEFSFMDLDSDASSGKGTITFLKDGNEIRSIEFSDFDEQSVVFEEGMVVKFSSEGADSEFILNSN